MEAASREHPCGLFQITRGVELVHGLREICSSQTLQGPKSKNSNAEINSTTNWKPNDAHSTAVIHSYLLAKTRNWSR